jgi:Protein of unknown function (DUF4230)
LDDVTDAGRSKAFARDQAKGQQTMSARIYLIDVALADTKMRARQGGKKLHQMPQMFHSMRCAAAVAEMAESQQRLVQAARSESLADGAAAVGRASKQGMCALQPSSTVPNQERASAQIADRSKWRGYSLGAIALGALVGFLIFSVFTHMARAGFPNRVASILTGRDLRVNVSSPSVVEKIRQLSRLETVDYSIDKIVEGDRANPYLPNFLVGDKLLLVTHGDVIAGVELSQLKSNDVFVNGDTVNVRLPQPQILTSRIDNSRTRVYSRNTGLLVPADPNLESQVRQAAEQQFIQAALADGILEKARQNARTSVSALLRAVGFQQVDIQ